ncbi:hypothetical protein JX266_005653 [Neoarthrinium moseri]|nr:hypothetical protein JX266_005653 [Neoarthrinium moseri]
MYGNPEGEQFPPAVNPVIDSTTSIAQETFTSTTSSTSVPQTSTTAPAATLQTSIAAAPPAVVSSVVTAASPTLSPSPPPSSLTTSIPVAVFPPTPESELQSQSIQTDNALASTTSSIRTQTTDALDTASAGNAALVTTIGTGATSTLRDGGTTDSSTSENAPFSTSGSGISTQTTVAVAGGVIGGLVALSLIAFAIWFWRKRVVKKRRSTMLTPLGPESGFGNMREKAPYTISRTSIGPTTLSEKLRVTVGSNMKKIRGRFGSLVGHSPAPSVNMNRGNSQFLDNTIHSRHGSSDLGRDGSSAKDRLLGFFGRSNDRGRGESSRNDLFERSRNMKETKATLGSQPDFLTLLSMDDKQLAAQANKGRSSVNNPRRSQSAGSNEHFLGSLGLNFESPNPFSDANAMSHDSAKVAPLTVTNPDNPFSDQNAIQQPTASKQPGPATYVQNIRRSRGQSVGGVATRPPSNAPSMYRQSGASVESFETRRNKFRSDPFDLDRPELLSVGSGSRASSTRGSGVPLPPHPAHTRNESFTSKYSSGVSLDQWSDPGPDVGPGSTRWESPTPTGERPPDGRRRSGASQGSNGTVGKAY